MGIHKPYRAVSFEKWVGKQDLLSFFEITVSFGL